MREKRRQQQRVEGSFSNLNPCCYIQAQCSYTPARCTKLIPLHSPFHSKNIPESRSAKLCKTTKEQIQLLLTTTTSQIAHVFLWRRRRRRKRRSKEWKKHWKNNWSVILQTRQFYKPLIIIIIIIISITLLLNTTPTHGEDDLLLVCEELPPNRRNFFLPSTKITKKRHGDSRSSTAMARRSKKRKGSTRWVHCHYHTHGVMVLIVCFSTSLHHPDSAHT